MVAWILRWARLIELVNIDAKTEPFPRLSLTAVFINCTFIYLVAVSYAVLYFNIAFCIFLASVTGLIALGLRIVKLRGLSSCRSDGRQRNCLQNSDAKFFYKSAH